MATFAEFKHPNITLFSLPSERSRLKHVSGPESLPVSIQWNEVSAWRLVIRVAAQMLLYRSLFLGYFLHMNIILRAQKNWKRVLKMIVLPGESIRFCPPTSMDFIAGIIRRHATTRNLETLILIYMLWSQTFDNITHRIL